jgi:hypothetical protein
MGKSIYVVIVMLIGWGGYNDVNRWFNVGIKAGNQTKQDDRLVISSRDALELVQLITGKMSDRQSVYARVRNMSHIKY